MSTGPLPNQVDPFKWADRGMHLEADEPLARFPRLVEAVASGAGTVRVRGDFARDPRGHAVLELSLATQVALTCQRCLEPVEWPLDAQLRLHVLYSEAGAERLEEDEDYIVADEELGLDIRDIVEDELLLSLPLVPRHESCELPEEAVVEAGVQPERENPFKVLAALKQQPDE